MTQPSFNFPPGYIEQLYQLLENTSNPSEQGRVFEMLKTFEAVPGYPIALLQAVCCNELSPIARTAAASILSHCMSNVSFEVRKEFKIKLDPFIKLWAFPEYPPLLAMVLLLKAQAFSIFGIGCFQGVEINQLLGNLLSTQQTAEHGLDFISELSLLDVQYDDGIVGLLAPLIGVFPFKALNALVNIAGKCPAAVANLMPMILQNIQELPEEGVSKVVEIVGKLLSFQVIEPFVNFLTTCVGHPNEAISFPAAEVFATNTEIPFHPPACAALFSRLDNDQDMSENTLSAICSEAISQQTRAGEGPALAFFQEQIQAAFNTNNISQFRVAFRCISSISQYFPDPASLIMTCSKALGSPAESEAIEAMTRLSIASNQSECTQQIAQNVIKLIGSPNAGTRMQCLRSLTTLFPTFTPAADTFLQPLVQALSSLPADEQVNAMIATNAFIEAAESFDITPLVQISFGRFVQCPDDDPIKVEALEMISALATKVAIDIQPIFQPLLNCMATIDDDQLCHNALLVFYNLMHFTNPSISQVINPEIVQLFLTIMNGPGKESKPIIWAIFLEILKLNSPLFLQIYPHLCQYVKDLADTPDSFLLSNICSVFFHALKFNAPANQKLSDKMSELIRTAIKNEEESDEQDIEGIQCMSLCLVAFLSKFPGTVFDPNQMETFVKPAIDSLEDESFKQDGIACLQAYYTQNPQQIMNSEE